MAGEKYTVKLVADIKKFVNNMKSATKSMNKMGMMNRGLIKNMQKMGKAARNSGNNIKKAQALITKGVDRTTKSVKKGEKGWGRMWKTIGIGAVVLGGLTTAIYALSKAWTGARQAAEVQVQAKAFANLANSYAKTSKELMDGLREASKHTVSDMQLMTTASRAILLGLPIGKLTQLMEVARGASKAMGTSVSSAFSDISLGIGRQSRLILDNLGIIVRVGSAYAAYAARIGTTADALTDFEKKQAFANAAIEQGLDIKRRAETGQLDFQDRLAQVATSIENTALQWKAMFLAIFITIQEFLIDSGIAGEFKTLFDVTFPKLLMEQIDELVWLLEKLGTVVKFINKNGLKKSYETAKGKAKDKAWELITGSSPGNNFASNYGTKLAGKIKSFIFGDKTPSRTAVDRDMPILETGEPEGIKQIGVEATESTKRLVKLKQTAADLQEEMRGNAKASKTSLEVITENIEALNRALADTEMAPQDLEGEFGLRMGAIEEHIKLLTDAGRTAELAGITNQYERLKGIMQSKVGPESFLAGLGILSETQFSRTAKQGIAKFERIMKEGHLTDPSALRKAYDSILKEVLNNVDRLTPELKAKFDAINVWMSQNAIPVDTISKGLNQWVDEYRSATDRMTKIGKDTAIAISSAFENFFFDAVTGQLKGLQATMESFGKSVLRSVSKGLADKATEELLTIAGFGGRTTKNAVLQKNTDAIKKLTLTMLGMGSTAGTAGKINPVVSSVLGATGTGGLVQGVAAPGSAQQQSQAQQIANNATTTIKTTLSSFGTKMRGIFSSLGNMLSGLLGAFSAPGKGHVGIALQNFSSSSSGWLGGIAGAVGSILPFAKGGITSLAGAPSSAMVTKQPTLAAISEKGQSEAIVPLDKFADMIQQPSITINAVDTKSFAQYMHDNKEVVLGSLMSVKGSTAISNMNPFSKGPF